MLWLVYKAIDYLLVLLLLKLLRGWVIKDPCVYNCFCSSMRGRISNPSFFYELAQKNPAKNWCKIKRIDKRKKGLK